MINITNKEFFKLREKTILHYLDIMKLDFSKISNIDKETLVFDKNGSIGIVTNVDKENKKVEILPVSIISTSNVSNNTIRRFK